MNIYKVFYYKTQVEYKMKLSKNKDAFNQKITHFNNLEKKRIKKNKKQNQDLTPSL